MTRSRSSSPSGRGGCAVPVGDHAAGDEQDQPVGEHLAVDAQVVLVASRARTASGIAPIPICSVAPSRTRLATSSPISSPTGPSAAGGCSGSSRSTGTNAWSLCGSTTVPARPRHPRVDLGDHDRGVDRRGAESHEVPSVWSPWASAGESLDQRRVERDPSRSEEAGGCRRGRRARSRLARPAPPPGRGPREQRA